MAIRTISNLVIATRIGDLYKKLCITLLCVLVHSEVVVCIRFISTATAPKWMESGATIVITT